MSHATLTTRNGDTLEISLPLRAEEFLKSPAPYFLAYGKAEVSFDTPDEALSKALSDSLPQEANIKEISLLAYILEKANEEKLTQIKENLPENPESVSQLVQGIYSPHDWSGLSEKYTRKLKRDVDDLRMTGGQLFEKIMERAKGNGDLARFDAINEYVLPEEYETAKLCSYEFDMLPAVGFGCEGIYIDCYLKGSFDESDRPSLHIGTIKTLSTDLDACKVMGELCGALLYHEHRFVNENLYLFDSADSIERMLTKPLTLEQTQAEAPTMTCQQM
jgi:hypothetical protein